MIKFENTEVMGWEAAIRGMRNPMKTNDRSINISYNEEHIGGKKNDRFIFSRSIFIHNSLSGSGGVWNNITAPVIRE